jgi:hypothetical protein
MSPALVKKPALIPYSSSSQIMMEAKPKAGHSANKRRLWMACHSDNFCDSHSVHAV